MAKHKKNRRATNSRDAPETSSAVMLCSTDAWTALCGDGYRPLTDCPELMMCVNVYADLIGSMTLHLMANTPRGDVRVHNELSRKLDITPSRYLSRANLLNLITQTLIIHGNQVTIPVYRAGYLEELIPVPPSRVSFIDTQNGYSIAISGKPYPPDTLLHFAWRPDPERPWEGRGVKFALRDIVKALRQADGTRQQLLKSPTPSLVVKVDGLTGDYNSAAGREELRERFLGDADSGKPWIIPAEMVDVHQVKPLTLADLAIKDSLELDKRAMAALLGVPPFMVGVGDFNREEYNHFVSTRVMAIAKVIEQQLTKQLIWSTDLYLRFNARSLMAYSISDINAVCQSMTEHMAMRRNEWRDWMGLAPDEDMDELLALENYIPATMLAKQSKLTGGDPDGETDAAAGD